MSGSFIRVSTGISLEGRAHRLDILNFDKSHCLSSLFWPINESSQEIELMGQFLPSFEHGTHLPGMVASVYQEPSAFLSTSWLAALGVVGVLLAAVAVLWIRFVSAQRRERELRTLVAEKTADLQKANEELFSLSFTDPLTGLANRRLFDRLIERECARVQRMNSYGSLLSIDVDFFKNLNDSEGHQTGDVCLMKLGGLLKSRCRRKLDLAARYGGEEFVMILPITNSADAVTVAESVRRAVIELRIPHPASPISTYLTVSIGVATAVKGKFATPETLIAASDRALYEAKRAGRNRVAVARDGETTVVGE